MLKETSGAVGDNKQIELHVKLFGETKVRSFSDVFQGVADVTSVTPDCLSVCPLVGLSV